jgi:CHAT domain-containing protein
MRSALVIIGLSLACLPPVIAQADASKKERLAERDRLVPRIAECERKGDLDAAVKLAEQMMSLETSIFGAEHLEIAQSLDWLADLHVLRGDFPAARTTADKAVRMYDHLFGTNHWRTIEARTARAEVDKCTALSADERAQLQRAAQGPDLAALDLRRRLLGEHRLTATSHADLAATFRAEKKYAAADVEDIAALAIRQTLFRENHPLVAASFRALAADALGQNRSNDAETFEAKALSIRRATLGEDAAETLESYDALSRRLADNRKFAEAARMLRPVVEERRRRFGPKSTAVQEVQRRYGNHLSAPLSEKFAAHPNHLDVDQGTAEQRIREIGLVLFGDVGAADLKPRLRDTATLLHDVAYQLRGEGQFHLGNPIERVAFALRRDLLGAHVETVESGYLLAWGLYRAGDFLGAERFDRESLALAEKGLGPQHRLTLNVLRNLSYDLREQGKYAEAEATDRRSLARLVELHGEEHSDTASMCNNLGFDLSMQGRNAEAEPFYRRALAINFKLFGEVNNETLISMSNLADTIRQQGDTAEAMRINLRIKDLHFKMLEDNVKSKKRGRFDFMFFCRNLNNLSVNLMRVGKADDAEGYLEFAMPILEVEKIIGRDNILSTMEISAIYHNLGQAQLDQGKFDKALASLTESLRLKRGVLGPHHPSTLRAQGALGGFRVLRGQFAEGARLLGETRDELERRLGADHPTTVECSAALVRTLWLEGKFDAAEKLARKTAANFEKARLATAAGGIERSAFSTSTQPPAIYLAALLARAGRAEEAWRYFEQDLGRGLLDDFGARDSRPLRPEQRRREQEVEGQIASIDKAIAATLQRPKPDDERLTELQLARNRWMLELGKLQASLEREYGPAAGQVYDLERIQSRLAPDTALVAWLDIEGDVRAMNSAGDHWGIVVRSKGPPVWVNLDAASAWGDAERKTPTTVRRLLHDPTSEPQEDLKDLHRQRFAPLEKHLVGIKHVVILPSRDLAGVPLEAVSDRFRFGYAPSATLYALLVEHRATDSPAAGVLALGDPAYTSDSPAGDQVASRLVRGAAPRRLPGTRGEVETISRLFTGKQQPVVKLLGRDAGEKRLDELVARDELGRFRFVHLATHGYADEVGGMNSYLALSPTDASRETYGKLSAGEIRRTWKLRADLVTLSACQTALGEQRGGEGYVGFAQALLFAGARSLVLSEWPVHDASTTLFMHRFYENLLGARPELAGPMNRADALADARGWLKDLDAQQAVERLKSLGVPVPPELAERRGRVRPFRHPFYWAPFILVGDPGAPSAQPK